MSKELEDEIKERLHLRSLEELIASFQGSSISKVRGYTTDEGQNIFVKTDSSLNAIAMLDGELESLKAINATKTIRAPMGLTVIHNYDGNNTSGLVTEYLHMKPLSADCATKLGKNLSDLHDYNNKVIMFQEKASRWIGKQPPSMKYLQQTTKSAAGSDSEDDEDYQFSKHGIRLIGSETSAPREPAAEEYPVRFVPQPNTDPVQQFGFHVPTSCGSIPQVNEWTNDWVSFYARHRLDVTIRSLLSDHSDRELNELWSHLQLKLDRLFMDFEHRGAGDGEIIPALLHGDLWSGNVAQLVDGSNGVIYDPASFYGHSEYEFGIVRMFGGFPFEFERSYFENSPKKENFEKRNQLYQLFHHLNHWNHFGASYRGSSLKKLRNILKFT